MIEQSVVIRNESGLHARPAALLVKEAGAFQSKLTLIKGEKEVDLKSVLGVMSLAIMPGEAVVIRALGPDEQEAVSHICGLIESGLGEKE